MSGMNSKNTEVYAVIPSVDELKRHRGELVPLKHAKRNDSYDSKE